MSNGLSEGTKFNEKISLIHNLTKVHSSKNELTNLMKEQTEIERNIGILESVMQSLLALKKFKDILDGPNESLKEKITNLVDLKAALLHLPNDTEVFTSCQREYENKEEEVKKVLLKPMRNEIIGDCLMLKNSKFSLDGIEIPQDLNDNLSQIYSDALNEFLEIWIDNQGSFSVDNEDLTVLLRKECLLQDVQAFMNYLESNFGNGKLLHSITLSIKDNLMELFFKSIDAIVFKDIDKLDGLKKQCSSLLLPFSNQYDYQQRFIQFKIDNALESMRKIIMENSTFEPTNPCEVESYSNPIAEDYIKRHVKPSFGSILISNKMRSFANLIDELCDLLNNITHCALKCFCFHCVSNNFALLYQRIFLVHMQNAIFELPQYNLLYLNDMKFLASFIDCPLLDEKMIETAMLDEQMRILNEMMETFNAESQDASNRIYKQLRHYLIHLSNLWKPISSSWNEYLAKLINFVYDRIASEILALDSIEESLTRSIAAMIEQFLSLNSITDQIIPSNSHVLISIEQILDMKLIKIKEEIEMQGFALSKQQLHHLISAVFSETPLRQQTLDLLK